MHDDWLTFIIAAFAIYRAARMITEEDGPAFVLKRLRARFSNDKSSIAVGLRCFYCVSFWAALPVVTLLCIFADWNTWLWPIWWFGLAGAAAKFYEYWKR